MSTVPTTLTITIEEETREIDVIDPRSDGSLLESAERIGAYRKPGGKVWTGPISFWRQADGSYKPQRSATFLNRSGYPLVAFSDQAARNRSRHGYRRNLTDDCTFGEG